MEPRLSAIHQDVRADFHEAIGKIGEMNIKFYGSMEGYLRTRAAKISTPLAFDRDECITRIIRMAEAEDEDRQDSRKTMLENADEDFSKLTANINDRSTIYVYAAKIYGSVMKSFMKEFVQLGKIADEAVYALKNPVQKRGKYNIDATLKIVNKLFGEIDEILVYWPKSRYSFEDKTDNSESISATIETTACTVCGEEIAKGEMALHRMQKHS